MDRGQAGEREPRRLLVLRIVAVRRGSCRATGAVEIASTTSVDDRGDDARWLVFLLSLGAGTGVAVAFVDLLRRAGVTDWVGVSPIQLIGVDSEFPHRVEFQVK